MPGHFYRQDNPELLTVIDSLNRSDLSPDEIQMKLSSLQETTSFSFSLKNKFEDIKTLSSEFLIQHIDKSFENWEQAPWKDKIRFDDFCEYILPYAISSEKRKLWTDYYRNKYLPLVSEKIGNYDSNSLNLKDICMILNDSLKLNIGIALTDRGLTNYPPLMVDRIRTRSCDIYVARTIYLMRSLGMPVGKDFTPQWESYSRPHSWNILFSDDGKHYPFMGFDQSHGEWNMRAK